MLLVEPSDRMDSITARKLGMMGCLNEMHINPI